MKKYILIQNEFGEKVWYMLVDSIESLYNALDLSENCMARQFIEGRRGLTIELIESFSKSYIDRLSAYIEQGKTVLINKVGGFRFLSDNLIVLKEVESNSSPINIEEQLNGILLPNGEFRACEYGHHYEVASEIEEDNMCISISYDKIGNNSSIFIGDSVTEAQKAFLKENLDKMHKTHILELRERKLI